MRAARERNAPDKKSTTDSKGSNRRLSGFPMIHAKVTMNGMTKSAICCKGHDGRAEADQHRHHQCAQGCQGARRTMLEPTATPRLSVSLSLTETVTAVTCSRCA